MPGFLPTVGHQARAIIFDSESQRFLPLVLFRDDVLNTERNKRRSVVWHVTELAPITYSPSDPFACAELHNGRVVQQSPAG